MKKENLFLNIQDEIKLLLNQIDIDKEFKKIKNKYLKNQHKSAHSNYFLSVSNTLERNIALLKRKIILIDKTLKVHETVSTELVERHNYLSENLTKEMGAYLVSLKSDLRNQLSIMENRLSLVKLQLEDKQKTFEDILKEKYLEIFDLLAKKYLNEMRESLSLIFGKPVFLKVLWYNIRFRFTQHLKNNRHEDIQSAFESFFQKGLEFHLFIKDSPNKLIETLYHYNNEFDDLALIHHLSVDKKEQVLNSFLKDKPELLYFLRVGSFVLDSKNEELWGDLTDYFTEMLNKYARPSDIEEYQALLIHTKNDKVSNKESYKEDVKLKEILESYQVHPIIESKEDEYASLKYNLYNTAKINAKRDVIVGLETNKYIFK